VTLSPVFRSARAIAVLQSRGVWTRLEDATAGQDLAILRVRADLPHVLDDRFLSPPPTPAASVNDASSLELVQTFFFLILFRSVLQSIGVERAHLDFYSELNFCVQGTIVAADNLFDGEEKLLLPLRTGSGRRFGSILQLLAFQRLTALVFERAHGEKLLSAEKSRLIQRELLSRMADIGTLEGSEETGVRHISDVETMLDRVHRVRGGQLFELSLIAPAIVERAEHQTVIRQVGSAISRLGTAFQIVDDLTDLEFDVRHGRQNLLVAQIHHGGTPEERRGLRRLSESSSSPGIEAFADSARAVLDRARRETRYSLEELAAAGFWWPADLADELVYAIVGLDGLTRMEFLHASGRQP